MTRFLSRVLDDPLCGWLQRRNRASLRLSPGHKAYLSIRSRRMRIISTGKISPIHSASMKARPLIALPPEPGFPNIGTFAAMAALGGRTTNGQRKRFGRPRRNSAGRDLAQPFALAFHGHQRMEESPAFGQSLQPARQSFVRKSSSDGNLPGAARIHGPRRRPVSLSRGSPRARASQSGAWTQHLARALKIPWAAESPLIVGLTSIFWREAWKYRDRAYRYCCHDLGHAMMSLLLAARALGLPGGAIAHFGDSRPDARARLDRRR